MKNLFTINELIEVDPCEDGLGQLTLGLGVYSGTTIVTIDDLEPTSSADILWGLRLLPVSDHEQKVIAVKVAVYAAELVDHLTNDDPYTTACIDAAKAWLDNPCEETREEAEEAAKAAATVGATAARATAWVAVAMAAKAATVGATAMGSGAVWVTMATMATDSTTRPKIKSYLIELIRELN